MPRYRWSDGPRDFTGPLPRDGATLRSIVDAAVRRGSDQAPPALLCKISQNGSDGTWAAEDGEGQIH